MRINHILHIRKNETHRTGVGKTRLAVDTALALRERGSSAEIINADSMQVYRGLDIITNKASGSEKKGVVHHLMDFLEPGTEYRVDRFRKDALQKVRKSMIEYTRSL